MVAPYHGWQKCGAPPPLVGGLGFLTLCLGMIPISPGSPMHARKAEWVAVGLAAVLAGSLLAVILLAGTGIPPEDGPPASFTFGAVGDLGARNNPDMLALAQRLDGTETSFLLGLGDLGYAPDEELWCAAIRGRFNHTMVIAGNHDAGESSGGNISLYADHCPFPFEIPVGAGPNTPGYGFEYFFDYPVSTPLARFILLTAGVRGQLDYDYAPGSIHLAWVGEAVQEARARGIPWVIVGLHKQCIGVGPYPCTMGPDVFDRLVDLRVDLILQGHEHVYQRSKQLALSEACPSVVAGGFDADCVAEDGASGPYAKGAGSVVVVNGAGGRSLYDVTLNGSDPELGYFVEVMGRNANTQGKTPGFGAVVYAVTADGIEARTDFCPAGTTDGEGRCAAEAASVFRDEFAILKDPGPVPAPSMRSDLRLVDREATTRAETSSGARVDRPKA